MIKGVIKAVIPTVQTNRGIRSGFILIGFRLKNEINPWRYSPEEPRSTEAVAVR